MLQAYHPGYKQLHDIVKVDKTHYMLKDSKGSLWGPIDKTKAQLVHLCKISGYQIF